MTTKKDPKNANPAADPSDIFAPVAPAADPAANPALDAAFAAETNAPAGTIDFGKLAADARANADARKAIEADANKHSGATGDNTPVDIETGEPVTSGFFMDLTKESDFELIAAGTRAVVSCVAAEAVLSGNGNPMLNLRVKIERVKGAPDMSKAPKYRNRSIKDRLMFIPANEETGSRGTIWRARLAFAAFDVPFDPQAFRTQADFMNWLHAKAELFIGSVADITIGVDDGTSGGTKAPQIDPNTGEAYPPKNTIAQYFKYNPVATSAPATSDLPF